MKKNKLKDKINNNEITFGGWTSISNNLITEIFSKSNIDFIGIDIEHSTISLEQSQNIIISSQSNNVACLPRIPTHDKQIIKRLLDIGADGIIVPNIESEEDIQKIVEWTHYPPLGKRGYGVSRAQGYGFEFDNYTKNWNSNCILVAQIESINAVDNIEKILKSENLDAVMIGPYDISGSLGIPGQINHEKVKYSCKKVLEACKKFDKPCGIQDIEPTEESINKMINDGYKFIILASDIFVLWKWSENIKDIINKIKK